MIFYEDALQILLKAAKPIGNEKVTLTDSLNRILAQDVFSDLDSPPFNKSAMDGFACKLADIEGEMAILEQIPAGSLPTLPITQGYCSKIMTGAMLPEGANCVVPIEDINQLTDNKISVKYKKEYLNICLKGEDNKAGQLILKKGIKIKAHHIAILATVGCTRPLVSKQTRIGIISTGDEIVEPEYKPELPKIRNSNAYQLIAQALEVGAIPTYYGIIEDKEEITESTIRNALLANDIVITTGSVSMGDFDIVPQILKNIGFDILFHHIAIQPGKPVLFATKGSKYFFGLPGNPVSSLVVFKFLVRPFIHCILDFEEKEIKIKATLGMDISRKNTSRKTWLPVKFDQNNEVILVNYHGSAHIYSLAEAEGFISIPTGISFISKGETVDVRPI